MQLSRAKFLLPTFIEIGQNTIYVLTYYGTLQSRHRELSQTEAYSNNLL